MIRFASLPLPIFSTFLALAIGVGGLVGHRYLEYTAKQMNALEGQFHKAIVQSGAFLASHLHELKQHIDMGGLDEGGKDRLFRSYGSLFLRHGELDQLEVYSLPACNLISKSSLDKSIQKSCFDDSQASSQFFWDQTIDGNPVMGLRFSLPENPSILLAAKLVLDKEWVDLYPGLAKSFRSLKLSLNQNNNNNRYLISEAGYKPQSGYMASLWSEHWLFSLLPNKVESLKTAFSHIQFTFLIIAALLAMIVMVSARRRFEVLGKRQHEFYAWCKDLLQNTIHPAHKKEERTKFLYMDDTYRLWCESLLSMKKEEQSKKSDFLCHFKEVNHENQKLKDKVKRYKEELSLLAENESLSYHICQNAPLLIEKQLHQKLLLKKIYDHNEKEFLEVIKNFEYLFKEWSHNLKAKGSRKFIRSLCEVNGENGTKNKLDENIEDFLCLGDRLLTSVTNSNKIIAQLYLEKDLSLKTLSYWSSLAFVDNDGSSMPMQIEGISSYVGQLLKFENEAWSGKIKILDSLKEMQFSWIPNSVLIASFYHIISMITSTTANENIEIVMHGKVKGSLSHLFVTLASLSHDSKSEIFTPAPEHWKKVKHLLLPYGVDLSYLPGRKEQATISLSWSRSTPVVKQNIEKAKIIN